MIEWVTTLSPTLRLAATLLAVVALMRSRVPMGAAFLAGAAILGWLFPMTPRDFALACYGGILSEQTLFLLTIVVGILVFSDALKTTQQIGRIIGAFQTLVGPSRLSLIAFPAVIGLLPMPGGAIFSAPMVEAAAENTAVNSERKTISNYWFRHVWEFWLPLYPGVILFLSLTNVPMGRFILMQMPLTLLALAAGYFVILHGVRLGGERRRDYRWAHTSRFVAELTPILLVVGTVALLMPLLAKVATAADIEALQRLVKSQRVLARQFPIAVGLVLGTAWLFARRGLRWRVLGGFFLKRGVATMVFVVVGLMVFGAVLKRSGAVEAVQSELTAARVPLVGVICALPFIAGFLVGIAYGFVATSFPLVIALLEAVPPDQRLPYYALAFTMGYTGMMLSPLHVCLILTNEYFKSHLGRVYLYLVPLGVTIMAAASALFWVYRAL